MKYIGNIPELDIAIYPADRYDYVSLEDPSIDINPSVPYATWLNATTGEVFVCISNTVDENMWKGQAGSIVSPVPTDSLVAHFLMDSIAGSVMSNEVPSGTDGSISGVTLGTGIDNGSFLFNGTSSYASVTDLAISTGNAYSLSFWLKSTTETATNRYPRWNAM